MVTLISISQVEIPVETNKNQNILTDIITDKTNKTGEPNDCLRKHIGQEEHRFSRKSVNCFALCCDFGRIFQAFD